MLSSVALLAYIKVTQCVSGIVRCLGRTECDITEGLGVKCTAHRRLHPSHPDSVQAKRNKHNPSQLGCCGPYRPDAAALPRCTAKHQHWNVDVKSTQLRGAFSYDHAAS